MTITNTSPYFLSDPAFKDLDVRINSPVTQSIDPSNIKDDDNDQIFLSVGYEDYPGHYIWAPSSLYRESPPYVMEFKPTDLSQVGVHNIRV